MPTSLRAFLVLGRISNLPTVWSDCLAAWLLGGGGHWAHFAVLGCGATLIYTGGMFLNDAFDVEFDRQYRPERPIISGEASARFVWWAGALFLAFGWALISSAGAATAALAFLLVLAVVAYDAVHKKTRFAPLLMATCRFLLYLVAGSAGAIGVRSDLLVRALALLGYIVGLSYIARRESTLNRPLRWPIPFLFLPVALALGAGEWSQSAVWAPLSALTGWVIWCVTGSQTSRFFRRGVAGLLAGIALVDWLALRPAAPVLALVFVGLFLMALLLQRTAPAT